MVLVTSLPTRRWTPLQKVRPLEPANSISTSNEVESNHLPTELENAFGTISGPKQQMIHPPHWTDDMPPAEDPVDASTINPEESATSTKQDDGVVGEIPDASAVGGM